MSPTDPASDPKRTPDALLIPESFAAGPAESRLPNYDKARRLCALAEPILGLDRSQGGRAYIRHQKHQAVYFVTGDPADQLHHPACSPRAGTPRYRWESVGQLQYGYLDAP